MKEGTELPSSFRMHDIEKWVWHHKHSMMMMAANRHIFWWCKKGETGNEWKRCRAEWKSGWFNPKKQEWEKDVRQQEERMRHEALGCEEKERKRGKEWETIDVSKRAQLALDWCDSSTYDAQSASGNMLCRDMQERVSLSLLSEKRADYLALHLILSATDFYSQRMKSSKYWELELR